MNNDHLNQHITKIKEIALSKADDVNELLIILREVEKLHREIREDLFEVALPDNRHGLYDLLKEVEEGGGWPYIKRMRILELLKNLEEVKAAEQFSENQEI